MLAFYTLSSIDDEPDNEQDEGAMVKEPAGNTPVGGIGIVLGSTGMLLAAAFLIYLLLVAWPPEVPQGGTSTPPPYDVTVLWWSGKITRETGLFIVVASVGALGGLVHSIRSFYWYVGFRQLLWCWMPMYLLVPIVAALVAVVFYVVLRGGLISGQASSAAVSPFGFAAIAGLVGLFSDQAIRKLEQVFSVLFTHREQGKDHYEAT